MGSLTVSPAANLSATSVYFGSYAVGATAGPKSISVTNSSMTPLAITSITVTGVNAKDFAQHNNCGKSLAAGAKCSVQVTFKPSATGTRTGVLNITDNPTGGTQAVILSGTATGKNPDPAAPIVALSPASLSFPSQLVHTTSAPLSVTLTNSGSTALSISSLGITGVNSSDFVQNNNCGSSLAAGANCTIVVLCTPSAAGGRAATLSISDNASGGSQTVSLSGSGGSSGGGHSVVLSWAASPTPNVVGYNVYRGPTSGGESSTPLNPSPINATTYTDGSVMAGSDYYYLVTAVTSDGVTQSAPSNEAFASIP